MRRLIAPLCLVLFTQGCQAAPHGTAATPPSGAPPVITDAMRATYWRSQAELALAMAHHAQASAAADALTNQLAQFCGRFTLTDQATREPRCMALPPATPPSDLPPKGAH